MLCSKFSAGTPPTSPRKRRQASRTLGVEEKDGGWGINSQTLVTCKASIVWMERMSPWEIHASGASAGRQSGGLNLDGIPRSLVSLPHFSDGTTKAQGSRVSWCQDHPLDLVEARLEFRVHALGCYGHNASRCLKSRPHVSGLLQLRCLQTLSHLKILLVLPLDTAHGLGSRSLIPNQTSCCVPIIYTFDIHLLMFIPL